MFSHASAWSGEHAERKANEALEWAAMTWARDRGCRTYDLEGIDPEEAARVVRGDPLPESSGPGDRMVTRYKAGFGGEVLLLPAAYERVTEPILCWGYRWIYPRIERSRIAARLRDAAVPSHPQARLPVAEPDGAT